MISISKYGSIHSGLVNATAFVNYLGWKTGSAHIFQPEMKLHQGNKTNQKNMTRRNNGFSLSLSTALLSSCALFSTVSNGQIITMDDDEDFPEFRYVLWSSLNGKDRSAALDLTYDEATWNTPGSAEIELLAFSDLGNRKKVAKSLQLDEDIWDCYINHYGGYDWNELADEEVQAYYLTLGWSEALWEDVIDPPLTDSADWVDLTDAQQLAAYELCFFEELWDEEHLTNYTDAPTFAPTTMAPTSAPEPTVSPTKFDPLSPTAAPVPTTPSPTSLAPTMYPTKAPVTSSPTAPMPTPFPTFLPFPEFRYVNYANIAGDTRNQASVLGYSAKDWNDIGRHGVETKSFSQLNRGEKQAALAMGYSDKTWDCFQSHYRDYDWFELEVLGLDNHARTLGWDPLSWIGETNPPSTDESTWFDLSSDQKFAARKFCYFQENWDGVTLSEWNTMPFPYFRYVVYNNLDDKTQEAAKALLYTDKTWDNPGTFTLEQWSYSSLTESEKGMVSKIGFHENVWDCHVNHYDDFDWSELIEEEVQRAFQVLGWNEDNWDGDASEPMSNSKDWAELTPEEQEAAIELCYSRGHWDELPLSSWDLPEDIPGSTTNEESISTATPGRPMPLALIVTLTCSAVFAFFEL